MCRGLTTARSRNTVASPNAACASRMAAATDSRSCPGSSTRRIPRPPPPATALTNNGKPSSSAAATSSSISADGADGPEHRQARLPGGGDGAGLVAGQVQHLRRRPDERDAGVRTGLRQVGVLRQESVAGVDRVRARPPAQRRSPRRPTGRPARGGRARRSCTTRRPSRGAASCGPRTGTPRRSPARARRPRGRRGSRSHRGWRRAACGTRDPPGTAERTVTGSAQMVGRGTRASSLRVREP